MADITPNMCTYELTLNVKIHKQAKNVFKKIVKIKKKTFWPVQNW